MRILKSLCLLLILSLLFSTSAFGNRHKNRQKHLKLQQQQRRQKREAWLRKIRKWSICLRTFNGRYVHSSIFFVSATFHGCGPAAKLTLYNLSRKGSIRHGDKVAIAFGGKYFSAERTGALLLKNTRIQAWEKFTVLLVGKGKQVKKGSRVAFRSHHGKYIAAEHGGGGVVVANRSQRKGWETFTVTWFIPRR